jgi:hypothetical protein
MLLIVIGLLSGIRHGFRHPGWIILIAIGGIFLADREIPNLNFHDYLVPFLIIAAGALLIVRPRYTCGKYYRFRHDHWKEKWGSPDNWQSAKRDEWIKQGRWKEKWGSPGNWQSATGTSSAGGATSAATGTSGSSAAGQTPAGDPSEAGGSSSATGDSSAAAGSSATSNPSAEGTSSSATDEGYKEDGGYLHITSIFSGIKRTVLSKNFKGGYICCVFGGAEIDFTQTDINGKVVLGIDEAFGGIKLTIPPHWIVQNEIESIFHGFEDKRNPVSTIHANQDKILILKGSSVFAGIEIKSY